MANRLNCSLNPYNYLNKPSTANQEKPQVEKELTPSNQLPQLNTPRSQKALRTLGMTKNELHFMTFHQFKESNPSVYQLPSHFQQLRYQFYNTYRIDKIEKVLETKSRISNTPQMEYSRSQSRIMRRVQRSNSTFITHKLRQFERLKSKNEVEVMKAIKQEIEKEIQLNEVEISRLKSIQLKEKQIETERKRQRIETSEQFQMPNEELTPEQLKQKIRRRGNIDRVNRMEADYINYLKQKQHEIESKILEKKEELEKKRLAKSTEAERLIQFNRERLNRKRASLEQRFNHFKSTLIEKDKQRTLNRELYELEQTSFHMDRQDYLLQKAMNNKQNLKSNQSKLSRKAAEYFLSQRKENERLQRYFNAKKEENEKQRQQKIGKNDHIYAAHLRNDALLKEKRRQMMVRNDERDEAMQKNFEMKQMNMMLNREQESKKQFLKEDKLRMLRNLEHFRHEDTLNKISDKHSKAEEYLQQKKILNDELRRIPMEIEQRKRETTEKLQRAIASKSFNKKAISTLRGLFPAKDAFNDLVNELNLSTNKKRATFDSHSPQLNRSGIRKIKQTPINNQASSLKQTNAKEEGEAVLNATNSNPTNSMTTKQSSQQLEIQLNEHKKEISKELEALLKDDIAKRGHFIKLPFSKLNNLTVERDNSREEIRRNERIVELNE